MNATYVFGFTFGLPQVETRRLPVAEYIPHRRTHILNIDTVVEALAKFVKCNDWKIALTDRYVKVRIFAIV